MTIENMQGEILELVQAGAQIIRSGDLRPGDVIVFATPHQLSPRQIDGLVAGFAEAFPGCRAIVLEDGMTVDSILHWSDRDSLGESQE